MCRLRRLLVLPLALLLFSGGASPLWAQSSTGASYHPRADQLQLNWSVETNLVEGEDDLRGRLTIQNRSGQWMPASGWSLYFNYLRQIDPESVSGDVSITRINGDFYQLTPDSSFAPIPPGQQRTIVLEADRPAIKYSDSPSGFYIVFEDEDGEPKPPAVVGNMQVGPLIREEQTKRHPNAVLPVPTPELRYEDNEALEEQPLDAVDRIVPTPVSVKVKSGSVTLTPATTIYHQDGLASEAEQLAGHLSKVLGQRPSTAVGQPEGASDIFLRTGSISVSDVRSDGTESYHLSVTPNEGIEIVGTSPAGVFYGAQSLRAWLPIDGYHNPTESISVPAVEIRDGPRFEYRGLHLDVARSFQPAEAVKRLIDLMAFYKLNKFHLHLTDDEGWRLAINGLPELTEVGGRRGHTLTEEDHLIPSYWSGPDPDPSASPGSGWYTSEEYVEILRYAKARHIEVIPEIDMPGHARAAIKAMQARNDDRYRLHDPNDQSSYESVQGWDDGVMNVCQRSTYRFVRTVIDELQALHEKAGAPLQTFHIGGDEVPEGVWTDSPACDQYLNRRADVDDASGLLGHFVSRVYDMLSDRGLTMGGWQEIVLEEEDDEIHPNPAFVDLDVHPYVWNNVWGNGFETQAYPLANAGYDIVLSPASDFYFGMAYSKHPAEPGVYWAGFTDSKDPFAFVPFHLYRTGERNIMGHPFDPEDLTEDYEKLDPDARSNIRGLQAQLWGEMLWSVDRMEYMTMPRLISFAERAWAPQPDWALIEDTEDHRQARDKAWNAFANRLGQRELPRLRGLDENWSYRVPLPGGVIEDGVLKANVSLPGLKIRYNTNGTTPTPSAPEYTAPVSLPDNATVTLRAFDGYGRGSRTVRVER